MKDVQVFSRTPSRAFLEHFWLPISERIPSKGLILTLNVLKNFLRCHRGAFIINLALTSTINNEQKLCYVLKGQTNIKMSN